MIRILDSIAGYEEWIRQIVRHPDLSDPVFSSPEELLASLETAVKRPDHIVFCIEEDDGPAGLFAFLVLPDEKYLEMITGLTLKKSVYERMLAELKERYPGYSADFIVHPDQMILKECLRDAGAVFKQEQILMTLADDGRVYDTSGIVPLTEEFEGPYCAMHSRDVYWTGEKVIRAPEKFRTFIAMDHGVPAGYIDVTWCYEENEPYDLYVRPEYRRRGWGRKLLAKAIETNRPGGMILQVDTDNTAAIRLYGSLGFREAEGRRSQTVSWQIR